MRRTIRTGQHLVQGVALVGGIAADQRHLRLDFHRGERRTQLVRGVGSEAPFIFQRRSQPEQQLIECDDQRLCFERRSMTAQFLEVFR